jgi:hypothetical protein
VLCRKHRFIFPRYPQTGQLRIPGTPEQQSDRNYAGRYIIRRVLDVPADRRGNDFKLFQDHLIDTMRTNRRASYAIVGDVHGHLQLALCTLARLQRERGAPFSAVFLVGDIGSFTAEEQLDSATRKHARDNPCELEFLTQWSIYPPPPWIDAIFGEEPDGLGLTCPVIMVHGNHEGFAHLETLYPHRRRPTEPLGFSALPMADANSRISFLPPGWFALSPEGFKIGGIGGMEAGQRRAKYHPMAYIEDAAVEHLMLHAPDLDVLLTHQGPAAVQGDHGSPTLDMLLDPPIARFWFHGHSIPVDTPQAIGKTTVVPLGDVAYKNGVPGLHGWAVLELDGDEHSLTSGAPEFLRNVRQKSWRRTPQGLLIHPDLVRFME